MGVSKKRYHEIVDFIKKTIHDESIVESIESKIKEVFQFDPSKSAYNPVSYQPKQNLHEKPKRSSVIKRLCSQVHAFPVQPLQTTHMLTQATPT